MGLIREAGFITAGNYRNDDPAGGLEEQLQLFEWGEQLGYDTVGVRERHLEHGVSAAIPFLAAASQRTRTVILESDVLPLTHDNPFRVAESVAMVSALAPGRFNVGFSLSGVVAAHEELLRPLVVPFTDTPAQRYKRGEKFLEALRGNPLGEPGTTIDSPDGPQLPRIQPVIPGILDRTWYGGGSDESITWAARQGLSLLLGNLTQASGSANTFRTAQVAQIELYNRDFTGKPENRRYGVERVIVPLDGADEATRAKYLDYKAQREPRTRSPQGPKQLLIAPDLVGFADEIAAELLADPVFDGETRLRISLPFSFSASEYRQILQDIAEKVLPQVGWTPRLT